MVKFFYIKKKFPRLSNIWLMQLDLSLESEPVFLC